MAAAAARTATLRAASMYTGVAAAFWSVAASAQDSKLTEEGAESREIPVAAQWCYTAAMQVLNVHAYG